MTRGMRLAKKIMWVAYQASIPVGMGMLHYTDKATEEDVWKQCYSEKFPNSASADYVFGRMMKVGVEFTENDVKCNYGSPPRGDYQSWAAEYPTFEDLKAMAELLVEEEDKKAK